MIVKPGTQLGGANKAKSTVVKQALEQSGVDTPYHILVGRYQRTSPQWSMLGRAPTMDGKIIALDQDNCNAILLCGVQGGGKSYTQQLMLEGPVMPIPGINQLVSPVCTVYFFWTDEGAYAPEALTMRFPNQNQTQIDRLRDTWGASPAGVPYMTMVTTPRMRDIRAKEYPGVNVIAAKCGLQELSFLDWQCLMGAINDDSDYMYTVNLALEKHFGPDITLRKVRDEILASSLAISEKNRAMVRLDFMERFVSDDACIADVIKPGHMVIVDLRDPTLTDTNAFRLLVVLQRIFSHATLPNGNLCPKVIAFDEFHIFQDNFLLKALEKNVRMMRHQGASYIFASQDPLSIRSPFITLSSVIICNRIIAPDWLKHFRSCNAAFENITIGDLAKLETGQGYIWARQASESKLIEAPFRIDLRVAVTHPGGATVTASSALSGSGKH